MVQLESLFQIPSGFGQLSVNPVFHGPAREHGGQMALIAGILFSLVVYVGRIYQPLAQLTNSRVDVLTAIKQLGIDGFLANVAKLAVSAANGSNNSGGQVVYQIGVKYDDGTCATIRQAAPAGLRVGDRVNTTTVLTTVDRPGTLEAYVYVPIEKSAQLKMNLPLDLVDSAGKVLSSSRVTFISPQVDNTTQTVLVKAQVPNNNDALRNAQFIRRANAVHDRGTPWNGLNHHELRLETAPMGSEATLGWASWLADLIEDQCVLRKASCAKGAGRPDPRPLVRVA